MQAIDYPEIIADAFRKMVAAILKSVEENGLPKNNFFVMSFRTDHPGAELPDWLRSEYPREMQIVMQHWFEDLKTGDAGFWVTLNFNNLPESIYVPFAALTTFSDPGAGVQFKFMPLDITEEASGKDESDGQAEENSAGNVETETENEPGQVVSLDKFRKN